MPIKNKKNAKLIFKDGTVFSGENFGAKKSISGEVVFATGMVGYPEALTDPSFKGQILVLTYPLVGNYGVPNSKLWESGKIQVSGLVVCNYIDTPSHHSMEMTLGEWFKKEGVPLIEIKDTRLITQKLRSEGVALGQIALGGRRVPFKDPHARNLVAEVSTKEILSFTPIGAKNKGTIVLIDCGVKQNIIRRLVAKRFKVVVVPWNTDVMKLDFKFSAVLISNGPGDPQNVKTTVKNVKKIIAARIPILGICLGNQILALAGGGTTYKLKFGHRSQNQPVALVGTPARTIVPRQNDKVGLGSGGNKCYLTTQNHGFSVKKIPNGFRQWFYNTNDNTNEGIIHKTLPFMSAQFHPESSPGPLDTDWVFDYFLRRIKK